MKAVRKYTDVLTFDKVLNLKPEQSKKFLISLECLFICVTLSELMEIDFIHLNFFEIENHQIYGRY